jgi:uncharacterized membrane protein
VGTGLMLVLAMAGTAIAQTAAADAEATRPWWGWVFLGRLHPLVVHFPIGLILAGAGFELVQWLRRRPLPSDVGTFCLGVGLLSGLIAVWFGTLNAGHQSITGESAGILEWHRYSGWAMLAVAAAALLAGRMTRVRNTPGRGGAYAVLVLASALLVGATGHFGGQLVYGSTYVTSVLPWNRSEEPPAVAQAPVQVPAASTPVPAADPVSAAIVPDEPAPPVASTTAPAPAAPSPPTVAPGPSAPASASTATPADPGVAPPAVAADSPPRQPPDLRPEGPGAAGQVMAAPVAAPAATAAAPGRIDFARQVEPIFRAACVECHGPDKVKARLRMDSVAGLQAGGKNGALFVPGDPDASLLMRRVLGLDGEDQMPLDNDPLTPEQLDTLRQWIVQGARYDARAATDSQPQP